MESFQTGTKKAETKLSGYLAFFPELKRIIIQGGYHYSFIDLETQRPFKKKKLLLLFPLDNEITSRFRLAVTFHVNGNDASFADVIMNVTQDSHATRIKNRCLNSQPESTLQPSYVFREVPRVRHLVTARDRTLWFGVAKLRSNISQTVHELSRQQKTVRMKWGQIQQDYICRCFQYGCFCLLVSIQVVSDIAVKECTEIYYNSKFSNNGIHESNINLEKVWK